MNFKEMHLRFRNTNSGCRIDFEADRLRVEVFPPFDGFPVQREPSTWKEISDYEEGSEARELLEGMQAWLDNEYPTFEFEVIETQKWLGMGNELRDGDGATDAALSVSFNGPDPALSRKLLRFIRGGWILGSLHRSRRRSEEVPM